MSSKINSRLLANKKTDNHEHNLHNKQLLDEVEHDIMNNQNRGLCYLMN